MANGLVTLRDAPASETLRTMHGTALPPNSIIPGFRTFSRDAVRWFSIGYSLLIRAESSRNRIARTVIVYGASRCGPAQLRDASRFRRALSDQARLFISRGSASAHTEHRPSLSLGYSRQYNGD